MASNNLNCRGDRRGMNGRNGPRGKGGRFVSSKDVLLAPVPPMPACYSIVSSWQSNEPTCSSSWPQLTLEHNNSNARDRPIRPAALKAHNAMDIFDDSEDDWLESYCESRTDSFKSNVQDPVAENINVPTQSFDSAGDSSQLLVPHGTSMVGTEYIAREAATDKSNFLNITCHFNALIGDAVLTSFYNRKNGVPKNRITTFRAYMVYQCARDRRSLGDSVLYATSIDAPFSIDAFNTSFNGFRVEIVNSMDMLAECTRLFVAKKLIFGTSDEIDSDMELFSNYPFYMLACTLRGTVHGACVFRVHSLNNGHRLIALELLASGRDDTVGAGTTLMQALRGLSMLSPRHTGHISAGTLTTKNAREFYARQLPDLNSPQARAFAVSVAFLDVNHDLKKHLDVRCTTVWPSSVGK